MNSIDFSFYGYNFLGQTTCITRMHSRMRTARLMPVSPSMHCSRGECTCPGGVPARGCTCQGECVPAGGGGGVYLSGGVYLLGVGVPGQGVYLPGGCTCPGGVPTWGLPARGCTCSGTPLLWTEFLTHATENITLPQTSFAGGKYSSRGINLSC